MHIVCNTFIIANVFHQKWYQFAIQYLCFCSAGSVLPGLAVNMDKNKDFLHKSWFSTFSRGLLDYFAFGNTQATDFFCNLDLGEDLDVLLIGAGEKMIIGCEFPVFFF